MTAEGMTLVLAKLDRARFHADQFTKKWEQFAATSIYTVTKDQEAPWTIRLTWTYQPDSPETQASLTELSLIYADLLGNLRATLDYLTWQLVLVAGNKPTEKTGFPAAKTRSIFRDMKAQKLQGIKGRWADLIESLQPYHAQELHNDLLFILDRNNNTAKHQAIHATIVSVTPTRERPVKFTMSHPEMGGRPFHFENLLDRPVKAGKDFIRITVDPPIEHLAITPTFVPARIKFEDRLTHPAGFDYTNRDLIQWVTNTVAKFEPAFRAA